MGLSTTTDSNGEISLTLKPIMDLTAAEDLRLSFLDCWVKGKTINVMAGDVERITTPCLQVLLAMKNKASEQQVDFLFLEMSAPVNAALKDVGLEDQFPNLEQKV